MDSSLQFEAQRAFMRDVGFLDHQLNGFNDFIENRLPQLFTGKKVCIEKTQSDVDIELPRPSKSDKKRKRVTKVQRPERYRVEIEAKDLRMANHPMHPAEEERATFAKFPMECLKIEGASYVAPLKCTLVITVTRFHDDGEDSQGEEDVEVIEMNDFTALELPIMVRSKWCSLTHYALTERETIRHGACPLDRGGYFIVNGAERFIVSQERPLPNRLMRALDDRKQWTVTMQVRREEEARYNTTMVLTMSKADGCVYWTSDTALKTDVPVNVLLRALAETEGQRRRVFAMGKMHYARCLAPTLEQFDSEDLTRESCLDYISNRLTRTFTKGLNRSKRVEAASNYLEQSLPGTDKFETVRYMLRELMHCVTERSPDADGKYETDSKDHVQNKSYVSAGTLLTELATRRALQWFSEAQRHLNSIKNKSGTTVRDVVKSVSKAFTHRGISTSFIQSISNGNWVNQKPGVTEALMRYSYLSYASPLRKFKGDVKSRIAEMRQINGTQYGFFCPAETPEGQEAGVVKHLAMTTMLSMNREGIRKIVKSELKRFASDESTWGIPVLVNGDVMGRARDPEELRAALVAERRKGSGARIPFDVSISYDGRTLEIRSDEGRPIRPLFILGAGGRPEFDARNVRDRLRAQAMRFEHLLDAGVVEFLDAAEMENTLVRLNLPDPNVADSPRDASHETSMCTHTELDASAMYGITAATIPFPDHNQSPRNTYSSAQMKHAISTPYLNSRVRFDNSSHVLQYPQSAIASTRTARLIGMDRLPSGANAVVGICAWRGFTQEDSICFNASSVDRGFMRSDSYHTYETIIDHEAGERSWVPDLTKVKEIKIKDFDKISEFDIGIPITGQLVNPGEIIIAKFVPLTTIRKGPDDAPVLVVTEWKNASVCIPLTELPGYVADARIVATASGKRQIQVKVRHVHKPQVGDKFSSRHAQKGIISEMLREEDMPFSAQTGMAPDVLINAHAFPSRMTGGHLVEMQASKLAVLPRMPWTPEGTGDNGFVDATPFDAGKETPEQRMIRMARYWGFEGGGFETYIDPETGERMECFINTAPVYLLKLKHLVALKLNVRSTGPVNQLTRQPTQGRKAGGGLRFGEMERDVAVAAGASTFLLDRTVVSSDACTMRVCTRCHSVVTRPSCHCGSQDVVLVRSRYAFKLLQQHLMGFGISIRLMIK